MGIVINPVTRASLITKPRIPEASPLIAALAEVAPVMLAQGLTTGDFRTARQSLRPPARSSAPAKVVQKERPILRGEKKEPVVSGMTLEEAERIIRLFSIPAEKGSAASTLEQGSKRRKARKVQTSTPLERLQQATERSQ